MFTLVACLVVVGLSAAAMRWQARDGGPQPATERARPHRQSGPGRRSLLSPGIVGFAAAAGGDGPTMWLPAPSPQTPSHPQRRPAPPASPTPAPARRSAWRRLRSAVSLLLVVIVIGTLVAAVVGAAAAAIAFALREAVK